LSVTDKTGIVEFASSLSALGFDIVSTGGTAAIIRGAGIEVRDISQITEIPEMLDGRVKTLSHRVAAGILAKRNDPVHIAAMCTYKIQPIDLVVVNFYDFQTAAEKPGTSIDSMIEQIDIGGPTMIRAAAKNWRYVGVVVDPNDYEDIVKELVAMGWLSDKTRLRLVLKAFKLSAFYEAMILSTLTRAIGGG
jgi:phosphoribosylaminoimidazolecarboxamide formyltransferase/IMP cyclohydrolase